MNESEFEAQLKADGYQEIELQELVPRPRKGQAQTSFRGPGLGPLGHVSRYPR